MDLEFRIGPGIYLCCRNYECYGSMVGKGGKAAVGGCTGVVFTGAPLCATCTGMGNGCDGDD